MVLGVECSGLLMQTCILLYKYILPKICNRSYPEHQFWKSSEKSVKIFAVSFQEQDNYQN